MAPRVSTQQNEDDVDAEERDQVVELETNYEASFKRKPTRLITRQSADWDEEDDFGSALNSVRVNRISS